MERPPIKAEFQKFSQEIEKQFKKQRVTPDDIKEAVKWARRKSPGIYQNKNSHGE